MSGRLEATDLRVRRHGRIILDGVSLAVEPGTFVALTGPNGAGKTTLLLALAGLIRPSAGTVTIDGHEVSRMPARVRATTVALVEQLADTDSALTVREVVGLGRVPHDRLLEHTRASDHAVVERVLGDVGLGEHADERWDRLSGGRRQRAHIARALAQEPTVLFLDEPTNHLDIAGKLAVLDVARHLTAAGMTVVASLHDLDLAATFTDEVAVVCDGRIVAKGRAHDALSPAVVEQVFGVQAEVLATLDGPAFRFRRAS